MTTAVSTSTADAESLTLLPLLKQFFGFSSFRPLQEEIIRDALAGRDVLALLPTGGGKSLCFQLPALTRAGLTVVVSPLISLMKDQVDAMQASGVPATFLNSSLKADEARERLRGLHAGEYRLLYVAPERMMLSGFLSDLRSWNVNLLGSGVGWVTADCLDRLQSLGCSIQISANNWVNSSDPNVVAGHAYRTINQHPIHKSLFSNATHISPLNPWLHLYYVVTGLNSYGQQVNPDEHLTREEALRLRTRRSRRRQKKRSRYRTPRRKPTSRARFV